MPCNEEEEKRLNELKIGIDQAVDSLQYYMSNNPYHNFLLDANYKRLSYCVKEFIEDAIAGVSACSNACKRWKEEIENLYPRSYNKLWKRDVRYRIELIGLAAEKYAVAKVKILNAL